MVAVFAPVGGGGGLFCSNSFFFCGKSRLQLSQSLSECLGPPQNVLPYDYITGLRTEVNLLPQ
jgi:hypothetical protein